MYYMSLICPVSQKEIHLNNVYPPCSSALGSEDERRYLSGDNYCYYSAIDKEEQLPFKTIVDNFILLPHISETVFEL